jgi:hypothetical protein
MQARQAAKGLLVQVERTSAEELAAASDVDGYAVWKRILAAVGELARTTPAEGERVN